MVRNADPATDQVSVQGKDPVYFLDAVLSADDNPDKTLPFFRVH